MLRLLLTLCGGAVLSAACAAPAPVEGEAADLILRNARVYTFGWDDPAPDGTPAAYFIEIRGLGIINARDLFGVSALSGSTDIRFCIEFTEPRPEHEQGRPR